MENRESPKKSGDGTFETVREDKDFRENALSQETLYTDNVLSKDEHALIDETVKNTLDGIENDIYRLTNEELPHIKKELEKLHKEGEKGYGIDLNDKRSLVLADTKTETPEDKRGLMNLIDKWDKLTEKQKKITALIKIKEELLRHSN